ncbi:MAG: Do family serine endopeptidase [Candidatus Aminicenantes bacterium]|nr:Do family serine endopeptidase [Candidatus Aminicenantes bacterium]
MKKTFLIALISFFVGILITGMIFIYLPEKNSIENFLEEPTSPSLASSLYASNPTIPLQAKPDLDFVKIADKVGSTVVQITAEKVEKRRASPFGGDRPFDDFWDRFFGAPRGREREYRSEVRGTGFFIHSEGYILTNNHLVEKSVKVTVFTLQEKEYTAEIIGTDPLSDLALLKIKDKNLPFCELADSSLLQVGEWVLAIGNPWGLEHTVTAGIVSSKGRQLGGFSDIRYQDYIQTDAAINPGNSGGPLVNMKGDVVGINTLILAPTGGNIGIGFAIPSNLARKVVKQLQEKGRVIRSYLGIRPQPITTADKDHLKLKSKRGALVGEVVRGTPADKAGLEVTDVIIEISGQPVKDHNDLMFKIADITPGTKVELKVIRNGKEKVLTAKLTELPTEEEQETSPASKKDLGLTVTSLTPRVARRYGLRSREGVLITDVKRYSVADRNGLKRGDIILEANGQNIKDEDELIKIVDKLNSGDTLMLRIRREGQRDTTESIVTLRIPE